jgi:hypothetical protein
MLSDYVLLVVHNGAFRIKKKKTKDKKWKRENIREGEEKGKNK